MVNFNSSSFKEVWWGQKSRVKGILFDESHDDERNDDGNDNAASFANSSDSSDFYH